MGSNKSDQEHDCLGLQHVTAGTVEQVGLAEACPRLQHPPFIGVDHQPTGARGSFLCEERVKSRFPSVAELGNFANRRHFHRRVFQVVYDTGQAEQALHHHIAVVLEMDDLEICITLENEFENVEPYDGDRTRLDLLGKAREHQAVEVEESYLAASQVLHAFQSKFPGLARLPAWIADVDGGS